MNAKHAASTLLLSWALLAFASGSLAEPNDHFIVRDTSASRDEMVNRIERYATEREDWVHLSTFGLKGGEVTAVKVCYLPLGKDIFDAGMHVAAMMPCGHIAVYEKNGRTHLSLLHPRFMTTLNPHPSMEKAVAKAVPAFETLLDTVWK